MRLGHEPETTRFATRRARYMTFFLPVFSIFASAFFVIASWVFMPLIFTAIFGLVCGGIVPTVMISMCKIDTSEFFRGKMLLLLFEIIFFIAARQFFGGIIVIMLFAEIIFAAVQRTDLKTKICLALSSVAWGLLGFAVDFATIPHK